MAGGVPAAIERGRAELTSLGLACGETGLAVDLGAGFGMHAIPLARSGREVVAIDTSAELLAELARHAGGLSIETLQADIAGFAGRLARKAQLLLCMGDTLTHLPALEAVESLIAGAGAAVNATGRFVLTFRDYSSALAGDKRFIPVRSDADRILTCFLEYDTDRVIVHDLLHERDGALWKLKVSSYPKLRLAPPWVVGRLEEHGFEVTRQAGPGGMVCLTATRRV
jgi:hypothetical protein